MREIKFRFWEKNIHSMRTWEQSYDSDNLKFLFADDDIIPLQYTGLEDRNGKEIYVGDILSDEDYENVYSEVYFGEGCFKVDLGNDRPLFKDMYDYELEIIGNIYENPELLT